MLTTLTEFSATITPNQWELVKIAAMGAFMWWAIRLTKRSGVWYVMDREGLG